MQECNRLEWMQNAAVVIEVVALCYSVPFLAFTFLARIEEDAGRQQIRVIFTGIIL